MFGRILQWLRIPGFVRPFKYRDETGDMELGVRTSPRYTVVSINGKELFFRRETGTFDGSGAMSLDDVTPVNYYTAERIRRLAGARADDARFHQP